MKKRRPGREPDYQVVFLKLGEASAEQRGAGEGSAQSELTLEEAQAIDELRQIACDTSDAEPLQSVTTT